jgi:hypothetical protein
MHFVCIFQKWVAVGDEPAPAIWCAPANGLAITALLQHIESQHPPDKEYCDNCACEMNDPVASCFRTTEIEHGGIVAWGAVLPVGSGQVGSKQNAPNSFESWDASRTALPQGPLQLLACVLCNFEQLPN